MHKFVLENWKPNKEEIKYLNVGTGKDMKIKEIAETISKKCGFNGYIEWDLSKQMALLENNLTYLK